MVKIGTKWEIKDYKYYTNDGRGRLIPCTNGSNYLHYEITDKKKTNADNFYIVAIRSSWKDKDKDIFKNIEENCTAIYDKKNKIFTTIEPEKDHSRFAFINLSILNNGKLRVKYLDEENVGYVVDLSRIKI